MRSGVLAHRDGLSGQRQVSGNGSGNNLEANGQGLGVRAAGGHGKAVESLHQVIKLRGGEQQAGVVNVHDRRGLSVPRRAVWLPESGT